MAHLNDMVNDMETLGQLLRGVEVVMLTTVGTEGNLHSRPMATLTPGEVDFDGTLWFFTQFSGKTDSVANDEHVNISYGSSRDERYLSIAGVASIVRDPSLAQKFWREDFRAFFPQGFEDPDLVLLKVEIKSVEYWDSPASGVRKLFSLPPLDVRHRASVNERIVLHTH